MSFTIWQVDAFTDRPFRGNPAAVCVLPAALDAAWMQAVASEMNLSETAFLVRGNDGFDLRWFTPTVEVALCGDVQERINTLSRRASGRPRRRSTWPHHHSREISGSRPECLRCHISASTFRGRLSI